MSKNLYNLERKFQITEINLSRAEQTLEKLIVDKDFYLERMSHYPIEIVSSAGFRFCGYNSGDIDTLISILQLKIKLYKEQNL